jgi:uncharacterized protein (DUF4415 family)/uncharacterized DUF497 family protein
MRTAEREGFALQVTNFVR